MRLWLELNFPRVLREASCSAPLIKRELLVLEPHDVRFVIHIVVDPGHKNNLVVDVDDVEISQSRKGRQ